MPKKKTKRPAATRDTHFPRQDMVYELKAFGDQRWRSAAKKDLTELVNDDDGIQRLADVIKAILRSRS